MGRDAEIDPHRVYTFAELEKALGAEHTDRLRTAVGVPTAEQQATAAAARELRKVGRGKVPERRQGEPAGRVGDQVAVTFSGRH